MRPIRFCYDKSLRGRARAYRQALEFIGNPILEHLPEARWADDPDKQSINLRFFNAGRINEHGGSVHPKRDVFMSHGCADKNYWIGRKVKGFCAAFTLGPWWTEKMRADGEFEGPVIEVGYPKLDPVFQGKIKRAPGTKPRILWAPTHHRSYASQSSFPRAQGMLAGFPRDWEVKLSPHPASDRLNRATLQHLVDADVVIADSGSTIYEAWMLGKPVIFPDWLTRHGTIRNRPQSLEADIYRQNIGYHANNFRMLLRLVEKALTDGMGDAESQLIEEIYPARHRGRAGEAAAYALRQIAEGKEPDEKPHDVLWPLEDTGGEIEEAESQPLDLEEMKVAELREIAKEKGLPYSGKTKGELIEALREVV